MVRRAINSTQPMKGRAWINLMFVALGLNGFPACKPDRELPPASGLPLEVQVVVPTQGVDPNAVSILTSTLGAQLPWLAPAPGSAWFDLEFHQPTSFMADPLARTASRCVVLLPTNKPTDPALWRSLQYRLNEPQEKMLRDSGVVWAKNIWAKGQLVLFFKPQGADFATSWRKYWPAIVQLFQHHTAKQLRQDLLESEPFTPTRTRLNQSWQLDLPLPADFVLLQANDSCWWLEKALPQGGKCWLLLYRPQTAPRTEILRGNGLSKHLAALIRELQPPNPWLDATQTLTFPSDQQFFFPQGWMGAPEQSDPLYCGQWRSGPYGGNRWQRQGSYLAIVRPLAPTTPEKLELWTGFVDGPAGLQREWLLQLQAVLAPRPSATKP